MRHATLAAFLLLAPLSVARGQDGEPEKGPPPPRPQAPWGPCGPDCQVKAALAFVESMPEDRRPYVRFFSWYGVPQHLSDEQGGMKHRDFKRDVKLLLRVWLHFLTFSRRPRLPEDVPPEFLAQHGVEPGDLQWVDVREYGWHLQGWAKGGHPYSASPAWDTVASRQPFLQSPWVDHQSAVRLARLTATAPSEEALNKSQLPVLAVVRGDWFLVETSDAERSPSYYDLLYSKYRFVPSPQGDPAPERRENVYHGGGNFVDGDGKVYPNLAPGYYVRTFPAKQSPTSFQFVDFPKDLRDWNKAFGIDLVRSFEKTSKVYLDYGAVVDGGLDRPGKGSIVALNNRLIVTLMAPLGESMRTFDVVKTTGRRDYYEESKNLPFQTGEGTVVSDGGELISYLPSGGQAFFLIDAANKRVNVAATKIANDTSNPHMNEGVTTGARCFVCHGPESGYIQPKNVVEEAERDGVSTVFKDPAKRERYLTFYRGWEARIEAARAPYTEMISYSTKRVGVDWLTGKAEVVPGWKPAEASTKWIQFKKWYDEPVDKDQRARELGMPLPIVRYVAYESPKRRQQDLVRDRSTPRRTFDEDVYQEFMLLYITAKARPVKRGP